MTKSLRPDPIACPPRGMSRDEAAQHIGVGSTKFKPMVPQFSRSCCVRSTMIRWTR
jgi:hypothetical protein